MLNTTLSSLAKAEELLAELAAATVRVAREHGFKDALIDFELDLWDAHRASRRKSARTAVAGT